MHISEALDSVLTAGKILVEPERVGTALGALGRIEQAAEWQRFGLPVYEVRITAFPFLDSTFIVRIHPPDIELVDAYPVAHEREGRIARQCRQTAL